MRTRRQAREAVLQALYQSDTVSDFSARALSTYFGYFHSGEGKGFYEVVEDEVPGEEIVFFGAKVLPHQPVAKEKDHPAFAEALGSGIFRHLKFIDAQISAASTHWSVARMSRIDRNILRLATYEIAFEEGIPVNVSINEAIELAKKYGSDDSAIFVNGVLDKVAQVIAKHPELVKMELDQLLALAAVG